MDEIVLVQSAVPGFLLGIVLWATGWVALWSAFIGENTEWIKAYSVLDWTLVAFFFLTIPLSVGGFTWLVASLYVAGHLLSFAFLLNLMVIAGTLASFRLSPVTVDIDR